MRIAGYHRRCYRAARMLAKLNNAANLAINGVQSQVTYEYENREEETKAILRQSDHLQIEGRPSAVREGCQGRQTRVEAEIEEVTIAYNLATLVRDRLQFATNLYTLF